MSADAPLDVMRAIDAPRVVVLGNAGAGKSSLARAIAGRHRLARLDLDDVFWQRGAVAEPRPFEDVAGDLARFCTGHPRWVIEGCYEALVATVLHLRPHLVWLDPGRDACLAHCRARPWEPAKYRSKAAQDENLETLLAWVAAYDAREGPMSRKAHRATFEAYAGLRTHVTVVPVLA